MATTLPTLIDWPKGQSTLSAGIDADDLSIVLSTGGGDNLPASNFYVVIDFEQILIDSRSGDTLTVNASGRGANGTTAAAHSASATVSVDLLKKHMDVLATAINAIEGGTTTLTSITTSGNAAVNGGSLTTTAATANVFNTNATTANAFGAATAVTMGAGGVGSTMTLKARTIATGETELTFCNTTALTVNAFGAATAINFGAAAGTVTIAGDLAVNGGDVTCSGNTLNINPASDGLLSVQATTMETENTEGAYTLRAVQTGTTGNSSRWSVYRKNDAGTQKMFASLYFQSTTITAGAEVGKFAINLMGGVTPGTIEYNALTLSNTTLATTKAITASGAIQGTTLTGTTSVISTGGPVTAGVSGTTRGQHTSYHGSGGNTPGVTVLYSKGGTAYYFFVTDAGVLRVHTALPTADTDGSAV